MNMINQLMTLIISFNNSLVHNLLGPIVANLKFDPNALSGRSRTEFEHSLGGALQSLVALAEGKADVILGMLTMSFAEER